MTDFRMANKYKTGFKIWFKNLKYIYCPWSVKANIATLLLLVHLTSLATYTDPTTRTNVNKVDPLLSEKIEDYKGFEQNLEEQKTSAVKGVESEVGIHDLVDGSDEVRAQASNLSNIRAEELEEAGLRESVKEPWINEYLLDYSKPGMMQHKEDAAIIANGTSKMLDGLIGILKKLDIDCKQVKGNKEVEPQYYIQPTLELDRSKGDSIYDKVICEELRNQYSCTDSITLKCIKSGMRWNEWQDRTVDIPGPVVYTQAKNLGYSVKWKRKRHGWHLNFNLQSEWRSYLSQYLNIPLEQIAEGISFPSGNWGGSVGEPPFEIGEHYRLVYPYYRFGYKYRDGYTICEQWQESWDERCRLQ